MVKMKKELKALLITLGISTAGLTLSGCSDDTVNTDVSYEDILDDVADSCSVDEVLLNEGMLSHLNDIEESLKLSKKLHDLDLDKDIDEITSFDIKSMEILNNQDLTSLIRDFCLLREEEKELECHSDKYHKIAKILRYNEGNINNYIYVYGYDTLANLGILQVKAKVLDAFGTDSNSYNKFRIASNASTNNNGPMDITISYSEALGAKKELYTIKNSFFGDSLLTKVVNEIYFCQKKENTKESRIDSYDLEMYNQERNDYLNQTLNIIKLNLYSNYEIDDDKIVQKESNGEVEDKFEDRVKILSK